MDLGNFSVSYSVKNLHYSIQFYETLGFKKVIGDVSQNWCVMQNKESRIGLFQEMFDDNFVTFNPKWNADKETESGMADVREIAKKLEEAGYVLEADHDLTGKGPGYFYVKDPDGNKLLFDQHV